MAIAAREVRRVDEAARAELRRGDGDAVGGHVGRLGLGRHPRASGVQRVLRATRRTEPSRGLRRVVFAPRLLALTSSSMAIVRSVVRVSFGLAAGAEGLEPTTCGFGIRCSTN